MNRADSITTNKDADAHVRGPGNINEEQKHDQGANQAPQKPQTNDKSDQGDDNLSRMNSKEQYDNMIKKESPDNSPHFLI